MSFISSIFSSAKDDAKANRSVVGIDVGSSSIKVVELQEKKGVVTLATYGEVQLGPYGDKAVGESVALDQTKEQAALIDVMRESAVQTRNAVFATPLSASFVTNVTLEADADADLAAMVRVEARKVIPASLSEVTLDWAEVEVTQNEQDATEKNNRSVLIAAIQNSALERFKVLMQFVGLQQPPTEIECFSVIRGLYNGKEENFAVIDIGAISSKLYIVRKGLLMRMYRIRAGGSVATKQIAEVLDVPFEEAEEIKCKADRSAPTFADVQRAHNASYDRAFREFNQVLREYEKRTGLTLDSIYMTGGGALFPGIVPHAKEVLNRDVTLANPFAKVAYPAFMEDTMKSISPTFAVALGAAMRIFE